MLLELVRGMIMINFLFKINAWPGVESDFFKALVLEVDKYFYSKSIFYGEEGTYYWSVLYICSAFLFEQQCRLLTS